MNQKKIIIIVVVLALVGIGLGVAATFLTDTESVVTLDINPSIELVVSKLEKVKNIRGLNDDGKEIVSDDLKNKPLNDVIDAIAKNSIDRGYVSDSAVVLLNVSGVIKASVIEDALKKSYETLKTSVKVIVPDITGDANDKAEEFKITPAKAAFINELVASNGELVFEDLIDKSVNELDSMKETGLYCDKEYTLDGESCVKQVGEEDAVTGLVCPEGYEEKNKKCYKTVSYDEEYYCNNGQTLEGDKCTGEYSVDAKATCSEGKYNSKTDKCEVLTFVSEGTKSCNEKDDLLLENGKCAQHHNPLHMNPDEVVNPSEECCCGDTYKNGWCYSLPNGNYDAKVSCPDGSSKGTGNKGLGCYKTTEVGATYSCETGFSIKEKKCVSDKEQKAEVKKVCPEDYKLYEDRICINSNETTDYIEGLSCKNKNAKLEDDKCIIYDVKEANKNEVSE